MNIALEQTEEYVNGIVTNRYGDAFIRGNNGIYLSLIISMTHLTLIQFCIFQLPSYFRRNAITRPLDNRVKHVPFFCKQPCWEPWLAQFISYLSSSYAQYSHVETLVPDLEELEFVRTSSINKVCRLQPAQDPNQNPVAGLFSDALTGRRRIIVRQTQPTAVQLSTLAWIMISTKQPHQTIYNLHRGDAAISHTKYQEHTHHT